MVEIQEKDFENFGRVKPAIPQRKLSFFMRRIFDTAKFESAGRNLKRVLNVFHLVFLGVSCTIGAGAYSMVGIAAQEAGPSIIYSFVIVGLLCFFTCFPFAEFGAKIQSSGFSYSFVYSSCGELLGYLTGHGLLLMCVAPAAICARCWAAYVVGTLQLIGLDAPDWLHNLEIMGFKICILGGVVVAFLCISMLYGMKESATLNNIVSVLNLITLMFAIIVGYYYVDSEKYYSDFFPYGYKGVFAGMGLTFYTFAGFEGVTCFTEESVKPERDIPIALVATLIISILVNGGIALIMTGMAPLAIMNNNESLLAAFKYRCPRWMAIIISVGSISGLTAAQSALLMCLPRTFYSMAYDRLLPKIFIEINPKTQVPDFSIKLTCLVGVIATLFFDVEFIGTAAALCGLLVSVAVDLSVIVARYDDKGSGPSRKINICCLVFFGFSLLLGFSLYYSWSLWLSLLFFIPLCLIYYYIQIQIQINIPESFVCPCVPLIPLLGALAFALMATTISLFSWVIMLWYVILGLIIYFSFGYWNSKLNPHRKKSFEGLENNDCLTEMKEKLKT